LTQNGRVMALGGGPDKQTGDLVFERCKTCHEAPAESAVRGPSLRGIVGAPIARDRDYPYSLALLRLGDKWTEERLDAFLRDPNVYAPGSRMTAGQVPDANERRALLSFLKTYR